MKQYHTENRNNSKILNELNKSISILLWYILCMKENLLEWLTMRMKQIETESESEREQKNGWLARFTTINSNSHYTAYKSRFSIQYIAWSSHLWLFLLLFVAVSIQMMFPNKILFAYNLCASGFFCFNARIRGVCWPKFNRSKEKSLKKRGRIRFKANCSQYGGNILLPIRILQ